MSDIVEMPPPLELGATPPDGGGSMLKHCRDFEAAQSHEIAAYGNELWKRSEGRWVLWSGSAKQGLIEQTGQNPIKNGMWQTILLRNSVDPNHRNISCYYSKMPRGSWEPLVAETYEVLLRSGYYDIRNRTLTPYQEHSIVFGPLIDVIPDVDRLDKIRRGDFSTAPKKFRDLMDMLFFALGNDEKTIRYFQQVVGQILRPHCGLNKFVHVFGESGARKTTLLRALLSSPCGADGYSEISEKLLSEKDFARSGLVNRIANLSNDSSSSSKFSTFIKEVTSGMLYTEKKFHDGHNVRMTAKLFATMNEPQTYSDNSMGVENRLIAFKFLERDDNNRSAEGMAWMDPAYYDDETRSWVCHWLLAGLESCMEGNEEKEPQESKLAKEWKSELLDDSMPIRRFVASNVKKGKGHVVIRELVDRAIEEGVCSTSDNDRYTFHRDLVKFISYRYKVKKTRLRVNGLGEYVFQGLEIVPHSADGNP